MAVLCRGGSNAWAMTFDGWWSIPRETRFDCGERGIQLTTDRRHRRDNSEAYKCRKETVLDGGYTIVICDKGFD
jgi:hypothetical protein